MEKHLVATMAECYNYPNTSSVDAQLNESYDARVVARTTDSLASLR